MNPHADNQSAELNESALNALGLHMQPFCELPSGHEYYSDPVVQMQLNMLQHNLKFSDMLQVLKGDAGSGKTAIVIQMLANASDEFQIFVARGKPSLSAIQTINGMLKIFQRPVPETLDNCLELLTSHLKIRLEKNLSSVLIIENAHDLSIDALNELLGYTDKINETLDGELRILLVADPVIESILPKLSSKQLREGKIFISSVRSFDKQRTTDYIRYRLEKAGYTGDLPLNNKQLDIIYQTTGGVPQQVDIATAEMLNQQTEEAPPFLAPLAPLLERLKAHILYLLAGFAAIILFISLLMFTFSDNYQDEASTEANVLPQTEVILPPLVIPEETTEEATTPATGVDTEPVDVLQNLEDAPPEPEVATIVTVDEQASAAFIESHGIKPLTSPKTPETKAKTKTTPSAEKPPAEPVKKTTTLKTVRYTSDEKWLNSRKSSRYTIQLLASYDKIELVRYALTHKLGDKTKLFETLRASRPWFVLTYGLYSNAETGRAAISKLPAPLRRNAPWIRSLKSVQQAIKKQQP